MDQWIAGSIKFAELLKLGCWKKCAERQIATEGDACHQDNGGNANGKVWGMTGSGSLGEGIRNKEDHPCEFQNP